MEKSKKFSCEKIIFERLELKKGVKMPNPKHRHSKRRGRLRRTFYKVKRGNLSTCPQCGKSKMSHRICPFCGYYKGQSCVKIQTAKEKKHERENKRKK